MIFLAAIILLALRLLYSLAEIYYERDWPRATFRGLAIAAGLVILCASAFSQAGRVDIPLQTYGPNVPSSGSPKPQALWVGNGSAYLCTHPQTTLAACQANPITTYTDSTEGTACPSTAQLVQLPGTTCTASIGTASNLGAWVGSGIFDYFVVTSYGTYGPYTFNPAISVSPGNYVSTTQVLTQTMAGPLDAPLFNNRCMADQQSGTDAAAKINACVALLPSTGGVIDARGLQGAQTVSSSIILSKPLKLFLGAATYTLNGSPGISVTSKGVSIEGLQHTISGPQIANVNPTILLSGAATPLIQNITPGADGTNIINLELNCNSVGTYGIYVPRTGPAAVIMNGLNVHNCTTAGIATLGGLNDLNNAYVWSNGTGIQWGSDGHIGGYTEVATNTGVGIELRYGGNRLDGNCMSDFNGSYGIWINGSASGAVGNFLNILKGCYVDDNTTAEVRIEGTAGSPALYNQIIGGNIDHAASLASVNATGIQMIYASNNTVSGVNCWGAGQGSGVDNGCISLNNSHRNVISGLNAVWQVVNPISLVSSNDNVIDGAVTYDTAVATSTTDQSYAIAVDSGSNRNVFSDVKVLEDRGAGAYSRGVNNAGNYTSFWNLTVYTPLASPNTFGTAAYQYTDSSGNQTVNAATGTSVLLGPQIQVAGGSIISANHGTGTSLQHSDGTGTSGYVATYSADGSVTDGTKTVLAQHYKASGTPTVACGTGAGTSPTVCTITGNDEAGIINVTTGSAPASAAIIATITLGNACPTTAYAVIRSANQNAAQLTGNTHEYPDTFAAGSWTITSNATGLTAATAYAWSYIMGCN